VDCYWSQEFGALNREMRDAKTILQEWAQSRKGDTTAPLYTLMSRSGPDHAPHFVVEVSLSGQAAQPGEGGSKREAEQDSDQQNLQNIALGKSIHDRGGNDVQNEIADALRLGLTRISGDRFGVDDFLAEATQGTGFPELSAAVLDLFRSFAWPGNLISCCSNQKRRARCVWSPAASASPLRGVWRRKSAARLMPSTESCRV